MTQSIPLSKASEKLRALFSVVALAAVFVVSVSYLNFDFEKFVRRLASAGDILRKMAHLDLSVLPEVLGGMATSIMLALSGLIVGLVIALVLSFLAASNIAPSKILAAIIKGAVAVVRAVPALVWILMIVSSLGFGNTPGMIGLIFPTVGYLTKSFIASIEECGYSTIEAMRATGSPWIAIVIKGLMPALLRPFASWIAIRIESNIAESINLGMVGIGGIGAVLMNAIGKYNYAKLTTTILVIFVCMFIVESIVNQIKRRL